MVSKVKYKALITGGTRGIGYAIAERLVKDGFNVLVTGTTEDGKGPEGSEYYQVDFQEDISTEMFLNFISKSNIDILVNNAGINKIGEFSGIAVDDFDKILKVNLRAPFLICQKVIPYMKESGWGRIINITSIFGHITKEYSAAYSASKFGLDGMTAALSAELSEFGIMANSVGPGFIDTELTRNVLGDEGINELRERIPMKRLGSVNEIASAVSWLVSEENSYLTGQNIKIGRAHV